MSASFPRRQAPVSSVVPRGTSSARKSNLIGPSDSAGGPRLGWGLVLRTFDL